MSGTFGMAGGASSAQGMEAPTTAVEALQQHLNTVNARVQEAAVQAHNLGDRLFGAEPAPGGATTGKPTAVPNGSLAEISERIDSIMDSLSYLEGRVLRLQKVG